MNIKITQSKEGISKGMLYNYIGFAYDLLKLPMKLLHVFYINSKLKIVQANQKKALKKIGKKEKIKVVFFLIHESVWKYDGVYNLMLQDKRFEPIVVVCPYITYGEDTMLLEMDQAYRSFKEMGYNVIKCLRDNGSWLNVKKELQPDMVFFTNPYYLTKPEYYIKNFLDILSFYIPYGFMITNRPLMQYNQFLHNFVFKIFHESNFHQHQAQKYSLNKGFNSVVTGYPGLDHFFKSKKYDNNNLSNSWKSKDKKFKRIIWAPHHTIEGEEGSFNYSNFLIYSDYILSIADKYKESITVSFKPHPILKAKLNKHPEWGEERTHNYYQEWENRPNCQLNEGDYVNLFNESDAMIHDSGSFLVEYISTNKPSLFMVRNNAVLTGFSELGNEIIGCHYLAFSKEDVEKFIMEVVLGGADKLGSNRETLIKRYLQPPFGKSASQNIMDEINRLVER